MRFYRIIILIVLFSFCAACSNIEPPPMPAALTSFAPQMTIRNIWVERVGGGLAPGYLKFSPAFANGKIFIACADGTIKALDDATGKPLWRSEERGDLSSGVALNDQMLFVGTRSGHLLALRQVDGKLVWRANLPSEVLATPVATNDKVIVRTTDGKLLAFATQTGAPVWSYINPEPPLILHSSSSPKIFDDMLITGFSSGELVALDVNSGSLIWKLQVAISQGRYTMDRMVDIDADPVISHGVAYIAAYQGNVAAVQLNTGKLLWQHELSSYAGLTVDENKVYVTSTDSTIFAFARADGKLLWQQKALLNRGVSAPCVVKNAVVVGDAEGYLHVMDAHSGSFIARAKISGDAIVTQPVMRNDFIYVVDVRGSVVKTCLR